MGGKSYISERVDFKGKKKLYICVSTTYKDFTTNFSISF